MLTVLAEPYSVKVAKFVLRNVTVVEISVLIVEALSVMLPLCADVPRDMFVAPAVPPVPMLIVLACVPTL